MAVQQPDADSFVWKAETICGRCGEVEGVTTGKMVVVGDNVYPLNLHVDVSRVEAHVCQNT